MRFRWQVTGDFFCHTDHSLTYKFSWGKKNKEDKKDTFSVCGKPEKKLKSIHVFQSIMTESNNLLASSLHNKNSKMYWQRITKKIYGTKYSRTNQMKFVEDSL